MSIVISEDLWQAIPSWFGEGESVEYDPYLILDRAALLQKAQKADALIVRNKTKVDLELLDAAPNLKVVGRLGVGLDNIAVSACKNRGIQVVAARGCNALSVAEYVMACLLDHSRFLAKCNYSVREGNWNRSFGTGTELYSKTIGLVGVGDIGQRVASRAKAFGMRVVAFDPFVLPTSSLVQDLGVELVDLETLLSLSHFVSVHVPLTPQTQYLIAEQELSLMRDDSVLINTARGGVIKETALYATLHEKSARAAYLDVREQEPPSPDDTLGKLDNIHFSPHIAGITAESSERVANFILTQVQNALSGQTVHGLV
ncbi:hydroxyacid dehydrogenase [Alicyclobacillus sp. SO9]|uniref:hydroxyacid dehydrogenase n=1 Tax=Alicyclobacillus sp. SO9 TaxID=2665646 RepID=UPI0018E7A595|nr:hydroxyacid dehydrogenase [Alicyclobacillus sp. SO9]QQE80484.1 hydroxyacid dehydrogenase [Alicyclobacillus sp. SO9]